MKKKLNLSFTVFAAALLISGAGCSGLTGSESETMKVGSELKQAQYFTLMNLKNEAVSLNQVISKNKVVLVNFWATWCAFCVEEMPDFVKLQDKYHARGFTILAVNVGESAERALSFSKKMGLNFPVLLDQDSSVAEDYGLVGIPATYLIASDGKIIGEYHEFTPKLVSDIEKGLQSDP